MKLTGPILKMRRVSLTLDLFSSDLSTHTRDLVAVRMGQSDTRRGTASDSPSRTHAGPWMHSKSSRSPT
jgi:hypothetical protein